MIENIIKSLKPFQEFFCFVNLEKWFSRKVCEKEYSGKWIKLTYLLPTRAKNRYI